MSEKKNTSDNSLGSEFQGTRIDLGEDLLEKSATISSPLSVSAPSAVEDIEGQIHSAEILISEGLLEQGKKILRRVLVHDPHHVIARKILEQVHDLELKQIFSEERTRRVFGRRQEHNVSAQAVNTDFIIEQLDRDLCLGMSEAQLSLFSDREDMNAFATKLDSDFSDATPRDRLDMGIGFLEMGLFVVAVRQFQAALRRCVSSQDQSQDRSLLLSSVSLLAYSLILSGRPADAVETLQSTLNDNEIKKEDKLELFYLMGRAYEAMMRIDLANHWYQQVVELNFHYRDVRDRLRRKY